LHNAENDLPKVAPQPELQQVFMQGGSFEFAANKLTSPHQMVL
jgi:hypothetical protein